MNFPLEIKAVSEDGTFTGFASIYGVKDLADDIIEPGAFRRTIQEKGAERPLLWSHDAAEPIGLVALQDDARGLAVRGTLDLDTEAGRNAYSRLRKGIVRGLSIGYRIARDNGAKLINGVRHLVDLDLHEVSLVVMPLNPEAVVTGVKSQVTDVRSFERFLHSAGWSKREAAALAGHGFKGLALAEPESDPDGELLNWLRSTHSAA
jgi:HK97 family phage prohead protease